MIRALTLALVLAMPAQAQTLPCGDERAMLMHLRDAYAEHEVIRFKSAAETYIITRAAWEAWTMIRVAEGKACIVAAGQGSTVDRGM